MQSGSPVLPYPLTDAGDIVHPLDLENFSETHNWTMPYCLHGLPGTVTTDVKGTQYIIQCSLETRKCDLFVNVTSALQCSHVPFSRYPRRSGTIEETVQTDSLDEIEFLEGYEGDFVAMFRRLSFEDLDSLTSVASPPSTPSTEYSTSPASSSGYTADIDSDRSDRCHGIRGAARASFPSQAGEEGNTTSAHSKSSILSRRVIEGGEHHLQQYAASVKCDSDNLSWGAGPACSRVAGIKEPPVSDRCYPSLASWIYPGPRRSAKGIPSPLRC